MHIDCSRVRNNRLRSFKIADFGSNRQRVQCNFRLMKNSIVVLIGLSFIFPIYFRDTKGIFMETTTSRNLVKYR